MLELRRQHDRLAGVQVRQLVRKRDGARGPDDVHVGQRRILDLAEQHAHFFFDLAHVADESKRTATRFGGLLEEIRVRRGADADCKEPTVG